MRDKPYIYNISGEKTSYARAHLINPSFTVPRCYIKPCTRILEDDILLTIEFDEIQQLERFLRKIEAKRTHI